MVCGGCPPPVPLRVLFQPDDASLFRVGEDRVVIIGETEDVVPVFPIDIRASRPVNENMIFTRYQSVALSFIRDAVLHADNAANAVTIENEQLVCPVTVIKRIGFDRGRVLRIGRGMELVAPD